MSTARPRAPRNRTLTLSAERRAEVAAGLLALPEGSAPFPPGQWQDRIVCADLEDVLPRLPEHCADLLILDPPYDLDKDFHGLHFSRCGSAAYADYLESWMAECRRILKPNGSLYCCGDWRSSGALLQVLERHFIVRNRIVWQREKGRGAARNWKNACEDVWFATAGNDYYFDLDAVRVRRKVLAPYRDASGTPKDWQEDDSGRFRLTCPGNFWDDLTVPYWSMPENTDHPTQKPEKLLAKLILASSAPGAMVVDPFLGSGTTAVAARKLGRHFFGCDCCEEYCCWALERLQRAAADPSIQGFRDGVFYERNSR